MTTETLTEEQQHTTEALEEFDERFWTRVVIGLMIVLFFTAFAAVSILPS
jgi:hypothetical protein